MVSMLISLGHTAAHSPMLVHEPNPSASIWPTTLSTRVSRSGWPWGSTLRWLTLAAVNNMAEALGQAATHAPQPMHAAASMELSATSLPMRMALASWAAPVGALMNPPAAMMRSNADRSTT